MHRILRAATALATLAMAIAAAGPAGAQATADVEVSGPAEVLLELLWRRASPDDVRLTVNGDHGALFDVHAVALTP